MTTSDCGKRWNADHEAGPYSGRFNRNSSSMLSDQFTDNREAQAASTGVSAARFVESMEPLEH